MTQEWAGGDVTAQTTFPYRFYTPSTLQKMWGVTVSSIKEWCRELDIKTVGWLSNGQHAISVADIPRLQRYYMQKRLDNPHVGRPNTEFIDAPTTPPRLPAAQPHRRRQEKDLMPQ